MAVAKFRESLEAKQRQGGVISSADLDNWMQNAQNEPNVHLHAAGGFGTSAHTLFESLLKREDVKVPPQFETVVQNFVTWREALDPPLEVIENEMIV